MSNFYDCGTALLNLDNVIAVRRSKNESYLGLVAETINGNMLIKFETIEQLEKVYEEIAGQ